MSRFVILLIATALLLSCNDSESDSSKLFRRLPASHTGITFSNNLEEKDLNIIQYLYYYNGGGVSAGDINNDGLDDLFFTSNEGSNRLYLNKGQLRFEDITETAKVSTEGEWSSGVTMADVNNDGWLDIFVCQVGNYKGLSGANKLYLNNRDLTFTESADLCGLSFSGFSTQSAFFDYDQDGDLDMFLLTHSVHSVRSYGKANLRFEKDSVIGDRLYRNKLETGRLWFENVTDAAGIYSSHIGYGLGVSVADVNVDGFQDIYVSNDFHENDYLYINQKNGTFLEQLDRWTNHTSRYAMGNDVADVNGDGLPDIVTVDMLPNDPAILLKSASEDAQEVSDIKKKFGYSPQYVRNTLQVNRGDHFAEVAQFAGIHATDWSWSPLIADFDNDGLNDIFITNGIVKRPNDLDYIQYYSSLSAPSKSGTEQQQEKELISKLPTLKISNVAFQNSGNLQFVNVSGQWGLDVPSYSNGAAYADLDNDGDLDLVTNNINDEAYLFENQASGNGNSFVLFSLAHPLNRNGIGVKVIVHAGDSSFYREVLTSRGFQSSVSANVHVGLGKTRQIDSVEIFWSASQRQVLHDVTVNTSNKIEYEPRLLDRSSYYSKKTSSLRLASATINWTHQENEDFKDYSIEPLIPYMLSKEGPAVAVGDINKDGRDDLYFGGTRGVAGQLFVQGSNGEFTPSNIPAFENEKLFEDVDAVFFDANGDSLPDLYVVTAGNEYPEGHRLLRDRMYLNDGNGKFTDASDRLPPIAVNGACVRPGDFDGDGDQDLFVGTRNVPGDYGVSPESFFLRNTNGKFDVFHAARLGMVTDAEWLDHGGDSKLELVVVGDWMPITILKKTGETFERVDLGTSGSEGWWRSVSVHDINHDGLPDIVAGNVGQNYRMRPSDDKPLSLYLNDFDDNGERDPVIFFNQDHARIPLQTKVQLAKQIPLLNKRFNSFAKFSEGSKPEDFLPHAKIASSAIKVASTFETRLYFQEKDGKFKKAMLPPEVNWSSVNDVLIHDLNDDGLDDIVFGGNTFSHTVTIGNSDAQTIGALFQTGKEFRFVSVTGTGNFKSSLRAIRILHVAGQATILTLTNNGPATLYDARLPDKN